MHFTLIGLLAASSTPIQSSVLILKSTVIIHIISEQINSMLEQTLHSFLPLTVLLL